MCQIKMHVYISVWVIIYWIYKEIILSDKKNLEFDKMMYFTISGILNPLK